MFLLTAVLTVGLFFLLKLFGNSRASRRSYIRSQITMKTYRKLLWLLSFGVLISSLLVIMSFWVQGVPQRLREMRMHMVQEERKRRIRQACGSGGEENLERQVKYSKFHHLIVDDTHGVIYCYVPKVACTNLKKFMLVLKNGEPYGDPRNVTENVHATSKITYLNMFPKHEITARLKHYTKFMFVRDPFVRLISAYRDKFEHRNAVFYTIYGRDILRLYGNHPAPPKTEAEAHALGLRPSFYNFIQYLVDTQMRESKPFGDHWQQMYSLCYPCAIEYDFIGHQETLQEDAEHLLRILKLQDDIKFPPSYVNTTSSDSILKWFRTVPLEDRRQLYKLFEKDFKLFGYRKPNELLED